MRFLSFIGFFVLSAFSSSNHSSTLFRLAWERFEKTIFCSLRRLHSFYFHFYFFFAFFLLSRLPRFNTILPDQQGSITASSFLPFGGRVSFVLFTAAVWGNQGRSSKGGCGRRWWANWSYWLTGCNVWNLKSRPRNFDTSYPSKSEELVSCMCSVSSRWELLFSWNMGRDLWRLMIYEWLITLKKSSGIYLMCELANVLLL